MSNPTALNYKLIIRRDGRRQVGPAMDFERTAKRILELYLEGFEIGNVELAVGQIGRKPTKDEHARVTQRAIELLRATTSP